MLATRRAYPPDPFLRLAWRIAPGKRSKATVVGVHLLKVIATATQPVVEEEHDEQRRQHQHGVHDQDRLLCTVSTDCQ